MSRALQWRASVARIVPLAWPVFMGQVAMVLFATVDTVLVARYLGPGGGVAPGTGSPGA